MSNENYLDIQSRLSTLSDKDIAEIIKILTEEFLERLKAHRKELKQIEDGK